MVKSREHGSLTGSKRYKDEKADKKSKSIGRKAKEVAESVGITLTSIQDSVKPLGEIANKATVATASVFNTANNIRQALTPTGIGYQQSLSSANLQQKSDINGELSIPEINFSEMLPTDLLHPQNSNLPSISEDELTSGLVIYAGAIRAQKLYQQSFQYIQEIGLTKQHYHKAEQSIIKAATESIKVDQEIIRFDKQNVELGIDREKLDQSQERLKQSQITTVAMQNETLQLSLKFEALEGKRDAEIESIKSQTQDIIQRYLKQTV
jgi:hypothetical protein